ncbi:hypothetical protein ACS0TY_018254 [Phlomoides rotata]
MTEISIFESELLRLSEQQPLTDSPENTNNRILPVRCPENRAIEGRSINIVVNHFLVKFNPRITIYHYSLDIKQVVSRGKKPARKLRNKAGLRLILNKLFFSDQARFPVNRTAYDGEKNLYSVIPLPTGQFKVELSDSEDLSSQTYAVSIKIMNELKLSKLEDYLSGNVPYVPRDILQGMDVVMKISVDRDFYAPSFKVEDDLKHGIAAHRGFQSTLRPTAQGLALCLDSSVLAFRKPLAVLEYLKEHIPKFDGEYIDSNLSLVQYFWEKYGKEIVYQDIPCLILGRNNRTNHVPMEFCILFEGQRYRKEILDEVGQEKLKKLCLAWPPARRNAISEMMQAYDGPCGDTTQNFGLQIDKNMTCIQGRVIGPPDLKLGAPDGTVDVVRVQNEKRQWNIAESSVVDGKQIERWALIKFSSSEKHHGYKYLKWVSETRVVVVTQCCLSTHANREDDLFLGNICLKINAKLGGINVKLTQRLPHFEEENHVMFIGADVNHPVSKKSTTPSIASACLRLLCSEIKESLE